MKLFFYGRQWRQWRRQWRQWRRLRWSVGIPPIGKMIKKFRLFDPIQFDKEDPLSSCRLDPAGGEIPPLDLEIPSSPDSYPFPSSPVVKRRPQRGSGGYSIRGIHSAASLVEKIIHRSGNVFDPDRIFEYPSLPVDGGEPSGKGEEEPSGKGEEPSGKGEEEPSGKGEEPVEEVRAPIKPTGPMRLVDNNSDPFVDWNLAKGVFHRCWCGRILFKDGGCNWVQCPCSIEWCWVTKKPKGSGPDCCPRGGPHNCH